MPRDPSIRIPLAAMGIAVFLIGLLGSFWLAGLFGFSPAILWSALVLLFLSGVYFLERPKFFLILMFLYYAFFVNGVFCGYYVIPIPFIRLLDEAILAVPLLIIAMRAIQRQLPRGATSFPLLYLALAGLSYLVNDVPPLNTVRVTLSYGKFFIFWYFARVIGPWSPREKRIWFVLLVSYALLQVPFNFIWQRNVVVTTHPDDSIGTIGSAHMVGYISTITLFLIAGWLVSLKSPVPRLRVLAVLGAALLIGYNLIFLTDTKHVLFIVPLAALPFLLYPRFNLRVRVGFASAMVVFAAASWLYLSVATSAQQYRPRDMIRTVQLSGRGTVFRVITRVLPGEVPFFILGAGPGNFTSTVALHSFRPLSQKYILPYIINLFRSRGFAPEASVLGGVMSSLYTLWGEFGPITMVAYYLFWGYVIRHLWRRCLAAGRKDFDNGQRIALVSSLITMTLVSVIMEIFYMGILMLPLWTLAGVYWDLEEKPGSPPAARVPPLPQQRGRMLPVDFTRPPGARPRRVSM